MSLERDSHRLVIAGASSLLGAELKSLLEESRFAGWDFSLLDEELAAGTLTEAAGEPAVILPVQEGSFDRAQLVFFAGSSEFTKANFSAARAGIATVIDLSGGSLAEEKSQLWHPRAGIQPEKGKSYVVPSAPAIATLSLIAALKPLGLNRLGVIFLQPVSEAGRSGIEELESQTSQLLSMRSVGHPVFGTQVAFNLLDRFGEGSRENLSSVRERIRREINSFASNEVRVSIEVAHAPIFYGYTFAALAETASPSTLPLLTQSCEKAGFRIWKPESGPLGNLSADDATMHLALPDSAALLSNIWWSWGAVDNFKLPASHAVKLAEMLA